MTWFRCGGAGIPAALKSQMNDVLNKKFGTSIDYPPNGWPDDVNLMGPLPEGTASGSIANFSDGADDVPVKNVIATIAPTLTGVSSVNVTKTGKNLFNVADYSRIYTDRDGVDSYNYRYMIIQLKPNTTYTVSQNSGEYSGTPIILINNALPVGGANYFDLRKASDTKTYTTDSTGQLYIGSVNSYDDVAYARLQVCNVQIEVGSTATTYKPYTAPTTYTASLGRTIHGGSADIATGDGNEKYKIYTASDVTSLYWNAKKAEQVDTNHRASFRIALPSGYITINNSLCYGLPYRTDITAGSGANEGYQLIATAGIYFCIDLADIGMENATSDTPDQDFLDAIHAYGNSLVFCVELATSTAFTFAPITPTPETALGVNNFWNDARGDTTVVYRRDIDLALQALSGSRGLMMAARPAAQMVGEESDLDQVNELVEDNETEQEDENNAR